MAARKSLERLRISPTDIDLIVVATATPDMISPSTACLVQQRLGCKNAWGFDVSAACSGFLYAIQVAAQFIRTAVHQRGLVIGVDVMSSITDYSDPGTCVLFGDGAGAVVIESAKEGEGGAFVDFIHEVDGSRAGLLCVPAGGSLNPASYETVVNRMHCVRQDGRALYKFSVSKLVELCNQLLARNHLQINDVALFIPHQGNRRIVGAVADRLGCRPHQTIINIDKFGNTGAATIPLALETAVEEQRLKKGDLVLLAAVGAGVTAGASLLRWSC